MFWYIFSSVFTTIVEASAFFVPTTSLFLKRRKFPKQNTSTIHNTRICKQHLKLGMEEKLQIVKIFLSWNNVYAHSRWNGNFCSCQDWCDREKYKKVLKFKKYLFIFFYVLRWDTTMNWKQCRKIYFLMNFSRYLLRQWYENMYFGWIAYKKWEIKNFCVNNGNLYFKINTDLSI